MRGVHRQARQGLDPAEARGARHEPQPVVEALGRGQPAGQLERHHAAERGHLPAGDRVARVRRQPRVEHAPERLVTLEPARQGQRVRALPLDAQVQRLDPPLREEGGVRVHAAAEHLHRRAGRLDPLARAGEGARDQVAVPGQRLGEAVHHEVGAQRERPLQVRRGEGVVDDHGDPAGMRRRARRREVHDLERRVGRALEDQHARRPAGDPIDAQQVLVRHEPPADAQARQGVDEQPQRAAVERGRAEHLVPGPHERQHGAGHRGHARGQRERRLGALERGERLLERAHRRVRVARVEEQLLVALDVAPHLGGGGEREGRGLHDRRRERSRRDGVAAVHGARPGPLRPHGLRPSAAYSPTGWVSRYLPSSRSGSGDWPTTGSTNWR